MKKLNFYSHEIKNRIYKKFPTPPQLIRYAAVVFLSSLTGFILHVIHREILMNWLAGTPIKMTYSSSITALAALTSVECGIGLVILYEFVRERWQQKSVFLRTIWLSALLLAASSLLFRQLIMDLALGGLHWQIVLNDLFFWIVRFCMCLVLIMTYEKLIVSQPEGLRR